MRRIQPEFATGHDEVRSSLGLWPAFGRKAVSQELVTDTSIPYLDHIREQAEALFEKCLELDLEGIVAEPEASPYRELRGKTMWVKIKSLPPTGRGCSRWTWYSQAVVQLMEVAGRLMISESGLVQCTTVFRLSTL